MAKQYNDSFDPVELGKPLDVGKKFTEMNALLGKLIRAADEVKKEIGGGAEYENVFNSLDIASKEILLWKNRWKKAK